MSRIRLGLWAAMLGLVLMLPAHASAARFCETKVVADYTQPLREMPTLRSADPDTRLPFGPRQVYLEPPREGQLLLLGQKLKSGYTLSIPPLGERTGKRPPLNWLVTSKLVEVDSKGVTLKLLGSRRKRVTGPKFAGSLDFDAPDYSGYFKLEILFQNKAGKRLGRFGEYFRVVPEVNDVRMTINGSTFRPGETVEACLENYGTTETDYGVCEPGIQVLENGVWTQASIDPPRPCPALARILPAGNAALLGKFTIPTDAPPGHYRAHRYDRTELSAEFQIVPG